jgi:hypothetical protein
MFRALQCPSSGASQTAIAASGFRMNLEVEVFSAVVGLLVTQTNTNKPTKAENTSTFHIHTETRGCNGSLTGS